MTAGDRVVCPGGAPGTVSAIIGGMADVRLDGPDGTPSRTTAIYRVAELIRELPHHAASDVRPCGSAVPAQ